jgi:hypothetical protein
VRVRVGGKVNSLASQVRATRRSKNQELKVGCLSLMSQPQKIIGGPHLGQCRHWSFPDSSHSGMTVPIQLGALLPTQKRGSPSRRISGRILKSSRRKEQKLAVIFFWLIGRQIARQKII